MLLNVIIMINYNDINANEIYRFKWNPYFEKSLKPLFQLHKFKQ